MTRLVVLLAASCALAPAVADEPTLKPDPPAKKIEWPAAVPAFEIPSSAYPTLLLADYGGPFALVSNYTGKQTTRAVYDLRTGKKVGGWKSENPATAAHALSPDGQFYVELLSRSQPVPGGAPGPPRRTLTAFDTATGKRLWEVELSQVTYRVLFVGPDRVLVDRGSDKLNPELYDAKTGKRIATLATGALSSGVRAASPGGTYLAAAEGTAAVLVLDAASGAVVERFQLPQQDPRRPWHVLDMSFSPDGARLAAALRSSTPNDPSVRILSWSLATGKQDADVRLSMPGATRTPMLQWSADSKAWYVIGVGMVDPDTGTVLWRRPFNPRELATHLPLSAGRLLTVNRFGAVREVALPKERIAAVLKAVQSGGLAVDGWLPTLAKVDRSATEAVTVPPRADDWTYQPDPIPAPPRKPLRLPLPAGRVASAHVVGSAVVCELAEASADSIAPRQLVRVDLATGKPTGRVELPHVARLADVSPGGEVALTVDAEDHRRVDVWDLGTGKPVAGWRPAGAREPGGELLYAALLSADRALTLTRGGELAVWSVPGVKAAYTARVPGLGVPIRSPGRKYLFAFQGEVVRVIEAATGKLVGDLHADATVPTTVAVPLSAPWSSPPLAVRPDGGELAAQIAVPGVGPQLRRWDLNTAKLTDRSAFTGVGSTPRVLYAGPDHLLMADADLYGLTSRRVEWRYVRSAEARPAAAADGRYWYVTGAFDPSAAAIAGAASARAVPNAVLVAAELPHPTAVAAVKAAADNSADNLLGPGKTVGVKLDLTDPPDDTVTDVRAAVAVALSARGLKATEGKADVVLTLTARPAPNEPKLTVRKLLPGQRGAGTAEKVALPYLAVRAALTADGKPVWTGAEAQMPPPLSPQPFRLPAKDTDLTAWLRTRVWSRLPEEWGRLALPRTLIRTPGGLVTLPGTSELGPAGPRPMLRRN